jgi:hypothetical protein
VQVEAYMSRVVDKMRSELRGILADSVRDYPSKPRDRWMYDWPGQIILVSWRGEEVGVGRTVGKSWRLRTAAGEYALC